MLRSNFAIIANSFSIRDNDSFYRHTKNKIAGIMPINFNPKYIINSAITKYLMRIEAAKERVGLLPLNSTILASLRETAKLYTTHYSTMIEGNQLTSQEVKEVIMLEGHFTGRESDERDRIESDITNWIEYFIKGMAFAFEKVGKQMIESHKKGEEDHSELMRTLDPKQRKTLELFTNYDVVTSGQIGELFGFRPRTNAALCKKWVESGFLEIADAGFRSRKYKLSDKFKRLLPN